MTAPPKVFVVDDNTLTRTLLADALESSGYEPVPYASAEVALDSMGRQVPAACVIDHTMPGMSGSEFIRKVRHSADERVRRLPIVGVSARFSEELLAAGADACIAKPFNDASVAEAIRSALSRTTRETTPAAPTATGLSDFRSLHERARAGSLSRSDVALYRRLRSELGQAFLAMQHMALPARSRARRTLRVALHLRVDLQIGGQPLYAHSVDLGQGGFSVLLPSAPPVGARIAFRLQLGEREWVEGLARVANSVPTAGGDSQRVGFTFVGVDPDQLDRVEMRVFDAVVQQLEAAKSA